MSKSILLSGVISLSLAALPTSVLARGGGGGAPQAPHMSAPQAPRMSAPQMPRMQAQQMPRMQAPQMPRMQAQAPRMQAPQMSRMEAPRAPRMQAPQMSRMEAPRASRLEAPRASRTEAPQMSRMEQRTAAPRNENARNEASASRSIERSANSLRENNQSLQRSANTMKDMTSRAAESKRNSAPESKLAGMAPQQRAKEYDRMAPAQRNQAMGKLDGQQRAETMAKMKPAERAEAMYKMNPAQRSETLARMSPQMRDSFEGRKQGTVGGAERAGGMSAGRKIALGGAALVGGGMAARQMMQRPGENVPARGRNEGGERAGENSASRERSANAERSGENGRAGSGAGERAGVPRAPGYANPRKVDGTRLGGKSPLSQRLGAPLAWRAGAERPRAGDAKTGRGGPLDPGGYTRRASLAPSHFTPSFATNQLAQHFPNYAAQVAFNHQNLVSNRANWPWQLPNYSPAWFNNGQGNWNWNQNWWQQPWQNWRNQQLALNAAAAQNAWWNNINYNNGNNWWNWNNGFGGGMGFWPWGINSGMNWLGDLNYYNSYGYNGANYPTSYFADDGYSPTPYIFDVGAGQFWQPGNGYADSLPENYRAPITVAIQESVPTYDGQGEITGYQLQNFYYNAFWVPQDESYAYYDYKQQFHYVTFPWLNSWQGQQ